MKYSKKKAPAGRLHVPFYEIFQTKAPCRLTAPFYEIVKK